MSRHSKHHTEEFKAEAVELVERSGKSVPEMAEELGINPRTLYHWMTNHKPKVITSGSQSQPDLEAENKRLRRELEITRHSKKSYGRVRQGVRMKYRFIAEHVPEYPVTRQCQVLEVAVSGYYAWQKRQISPRQQKDEQLSQAIQVIYKQHRGLYGSPRIHAELKKKGGRAVANEWRD